MITGRNLGFLLTLKDNISLSFIFNINLFIYLCLRWVFVAAKQQAVGFLSLQRAGATLRCGAQASHCGGFSCCGARALGTQASVVVAHGLSCSAACLVPRPGTEPVSPTLAGRLLTTVPPGKSPYSFVCIKLFHYTLSKCFTDKKWGRRGRKVLSGLPKVPR